PERITVPYPVESQLSGLERHEDHMFYRRQFEVPRDWGIGRGERLKLNFGAVDHHARVWVDGTPVAEHTGGYTAFTADITDALRGGGKHELIVAVTDTTGDNQPIGKQSRNPGGIVYTPSSGIWQTVWLEP
ncbi:glycoside hydrolase family 2, partial [Saccharothrix sp. MB29]|nr:glycoside hydrolase family 2 [Saccharothrix sp. MB29]